jgi:DNA modification methylase
MNESSSLINTDAISFLQSVPTNSVNLILTDPPYIISRKSGMESHYQSVSALAKNGNNAKTEAEWIEYKKTLDKPKEELQAEKGKGWSKDNYIKYGSILGKKYSVQTDFGKWDSEFTFETMETCIREYYKKLKKGGTCIIWFDIWKMETMKRLMEQYKFKQIRLIEWVKTNPQPINSKVNYLSNCRKIQVSSHIEKFGFNVRSH